MSHMGLWSRKNGKKSSRSASFTLCYIAKAKSIPYVVCMTSKEKMAAAEHYPPKVSRGGKSL